MNLGPRRLLTRLRPKDHGWVYADAAIRLKRKRNRGRTRFRVFALLIQEHPVFIAVTLHLILLTFSVLSMFFPVPFMSKLAPKDSASALSTAWQVHAGFVAIAFAGLAVLFQTSSPQQMLSPEQLRAILFRHTYFSVVLVFCVVGAAELGVVAVWFPSDGSLLIQIIAVVIASMLLVGAAYFRATKALTQSDYATKKSEDDLVEILRDSMDSSQAITLSNGELADVIDMSYGLPDDADRQFILSARAIELEDVHLPTIKQILKQIQSIATTSEVRKTNTGVPDLAADPEVTPKLCINAAIGATLSPNMPLFTVKNSSNLQGNWKRLEAQLKKAVKIRDDDYQE